MDRKITLANKAMGFIKGLMFSWNAEKSGKDIFKYSKFFVVGFALIFVQSLNGTHDFLLNKFGDIGITLFKLLPSLTSVIFTSGVVYILFGRNTEKLLTEVATSPETIIHRIPPEKIPAYFKKYMTDKFHLKEENSEAYWDILEKQLLDSREYHKDKFVMIEIVGIPDERGYRKLRITEIFQILKPKLEDQLIFSCRLSGNPMDVIYDDNYTLSWIFVQNSVDTVLPKDAFNCINVSVGGEKKEVTRRNNNDPNHIIFETEKIKDLNGKRVIFTLEVLQYSGHGFVSNHTKNLTHNYTVSLNYVNAHDISDVYAVEFFLSNGKITGLDTDKLLIRTIAGWVAPKGGVTFTWVNNPHENSHKMAQTPTSEQDV